MVRFDARPADTTVIFIGSPSIPLVSFGGGGGREGQCSGGGRGGEGGEGGGAARTAEGQQGHRSRGRSNTASAEVDKLYRCWALTGG